MAISAGAYMPSAENLKNREWFQDAKFGLFIHWGVYSVLGDGEWVMHEKKIPAAEYEKLPPLFNPTGFDATAWVQMAKAAGMRYITFTSKHHDGFAMWKTKQNQWNVVDATPYGKDIVRQLADACRAEGLKLFLYHSQLDWHHRDYFPLGRTGQFAGRPAEGDFHRYLDFMDTQLEELLTEYGPIAGIWFDGMWDRPGAEWRLEKTYSLIHRLQPSALIGSNHHLAPFEGEDFQMFEKDLPGQNRSGYSPDAKIGNLPLETCETINNSWGFNRTDQRFKSTREIIHYLVRAAGHNANFLLNVGPTPEGTFQPEFIQRLQEVGSWLQTHGSSLYGTRAGPISPRTWGVTTRSADKVYLHLLECDDAMLALPHFGGSNPRLLKTGEALRTSPIEEGFVLHLPASSRDEFDTVVVFDAPQTQGVSTHN